METDTVWPGPWSWLLLDAVRVLHEQGYQRTRVSTYMSPTGLFWRLSVWPAEASAEKAAQGTEDTPHFDWSSGMEGDELGPLSLGSATAEDVAGFLMHQLGAENLAGSDRPYADWFAHLLNVAHAAGEIPVSFTAEWDVEGAMVGEVELPAPPPPSLPTVADPEPGWEAVQQPHTETPAFTLGLGTVLQAAGLDLDDVIVIRHVVGPGKPSLLQGLDPQTLLEYTREQKRGPGKFPANPPTWWVVLIGEPGLLGRLYCVYQNHGELAGAATPTRRTYQLTVAAGFSSLEGRLVVRWSKDPVNWVKKGSIAANFPVVELADRALVPFPGYDKVLLDHATLQTVVSDPRHTLWQAALAAVKGIYLIADTATGRLYVGKADGSEGVLGRWKSYAANGHGGNVAMADLLALDPEQPQRYQFSLLRVFDPAVVQAEVDQAEQHFKTALLSQTFGLNKN